MRFRKTADLAAVPASLTALIAADSRYWLFINGVPVVFEGSAKRGPTPEGGYYDSVPIGAFLKPGKNIVCALVWYWGKKKSFSSRDSGRAGFLFEAGEILSDGSWKVSRHPSYGNGRGGRKPNYRLPEFNIDYDARRDPGDWLSPGFDDGGWANAAANGKGGVAPWGRLYPRGIPLLKDYGLKDYKNTEDFRGRRFARRRRITLRIPYNAQCTPFLRVDAKAGKTIRITTENTYLGAVSDAYITKGGKQSFEALGWFNGEKIRYSIPPGVTVLDLKYRETGFDTAFSGAFTCEDGALNTLWQKSLRTLYVTMRDSFMDCPDRERAQWWGDVTTEMMMALYALDANALLLYQKGVACMLGHVDPATRVLPTVAPIDDGFFELPAQQLAGIAGFWTYYLYTGDRDFLKEVYDAAAAYLRLWRIGADGLAEHRAGSWDWMDWGLFADRTAMENAWYCYALSCLEKMAEALGKDAGEFTDRKNRIRNGYRSLWTGKCYKSGGVLRPDDRANALAVLAGLAEPAQYDALTAVLTKTKNASPYMEYYVLEALCRMGRCDAAKERMRRRYAAMIRADCSTLWERWSRLGGTCNHAWSGGPLVVMSKYFAGIRPLTPGWETFVMAPQPGVCGRIACTVPTVKGYIRLEMTETDGAVALDASVPKDTTAVIRIPYTRGQTLTYNGAALYEDGRFTERDAVRLAEAGDGFVTVSVAATENLRLHFDTALGWK